MTEFIQTDLPLLASRQFATAHLHCGSCLPYHALWPYLRLTKWVGGIEADQAQLVPALSALLSHEPRRVLIAGSADSGVTALVRHASGAMARRHEINVVDHCETPLRACRDYAAEHGLSLRTLCRDLRDLDWADVADVVVGHSVLPWLPVGDRASALRRLHVALAPGGRMVINTRLSPSGTAAAPKQRPAGWASEMKSTLLTRLAQQGIADPGDAEEFDRLARNYVPIGFSHPAYADQAELERDFTAAGFAVAQWIHSGAGPAYLPDGSVKAQARHGLVAVTQAK